MIKQIQKDSPLAFEKFLLEVVRIKKKKLASPQTKEGVLEHILEYGTDFDFFHYFEKQGIYGYVVPVVPYIKDFTVTWSIIHWKKSYYARRIEADKFWQVGQRTACMEACIIKMFTIENKKLEKKCL